MIFCRDRFLPVSVAVLLGLTGVAHAAAAKNDQINAIVTAPAQAKFADVIKITTVLRAKKVTDIRLQLAPAGQQTIGVRLNVGGDTLHERVVEILDALAKAKAKPIELSTIADPDSR